MKKFNFTAIYILVFALFITACDDNNKQESSSENAEKVDTNSREGLKKKIAEHEAALYSDSLSTFNQRAANLAMKAYDKYAFSFPEDEISADYLFKAGEVAVSLGMYGKAVIYYRKIIADYKDYEKVGYAHFMLGFINDQYIQNFESAKTYYEEFIAKYPEHVMVKDAKVLVQNLGKSDEELIKEFEAKMN